MRAEVVGPSLRASVLPLVLIALAITALGCGENQRESAPTSTAIPSTTGTTSSIATSSTALTTEPRGPSVPADPNETVALDFLEAWRRGASGQEAYLLIGEPGSGDGIIWWISVSHDE